MDGRQGACRISCGLKSHAGQHTGCLHTCELSLISPQVSLKHPEVGQELLSLPEHDGVALVGRGLEGAAAKMQRFLALEWQRKQGCVKCMFAGAIGDPGCQPAASYRPRKARCAMIALRLRTVRVAGKEAPKCNDICAIWLPELFEGNAPQRFLPTRRTNFLRMNSMSSRCTLRVILTSKKSRNVPFQTFALSLTSFSTQVAATSRARRCRHFCIEPRNTSSPQILVLNVRGPNFTSLLCCPEAFMAC